MAIVRPICVMMARARQAIAGGMPRAPVRGRKEAKAAIPRQRAALYIRYAVVRTAPRYVGAMRLLNV